jgi:hypothetical protein
LRKGQCSAEAHNFGQPGASPGSATVGPVVQRQRPPAYNRATMVRVHPGLLTGTEYAVPSTQCSDAVIAYSVLGTVTGCSSKGRTPVSHAGNRGSIPRRSTERSGESSNGKTPAWRAGDPGSTPGSSTGDKCYGSTRALGACGGSSTLPSPTGPSRKRPGHCRRGSTIARRLPRKQDHAGATPAVGSSSRWCNGQHRTLRRFRSWFDSRSGHY